MKYYLKNQTFKTY